MVFHLHTNHSASRRNQDPRQSQDEVTTQGGKFRADTLAAKLPERARQKLSAGAGARGLCV
ncbi:MAG: hypothetical protein QOI83_1225 [Streptomycetaceae bacterium]|jgi:hypothetical protein|nr:hypothetical protein [Streptomycetaceae bacterium]